MSALDSLYHYIPDTVRAVAATHRYIVIIPDPDGGDPLYVYHYGEHSGAVGASRFEHAAIQFDSYEDALRCAAVVGPEAMVKGVNDDTDPDPTS